MPNVTITLTQEAYRNARIWAAKHDTTVTAAVRIFLEKAPEFSAAKLGVPRRGDSPAPANPAAKTQTSSAAQNEKSDEPENPMQALFSRSGNWETGSRSSQKTYRPFPDPVSQFPSAARPSDIATKRSRT
jgi:hypothetical protein